MKMYNEGIEIVEDLYEDVLNNWYVAREETTALLLKTIRYERKNEIFSGFISDLIFLDKKLLDLFNDYLKETIFVGKEQEFYEANTETCIDKMVDYLLEVDDNIEKVLNVVNLNKVAIKKLKQEGN